jgi:hypothetical protein
VTFSVTDGTLSDTETATITVSNVNRAPVLSPIPAKTVDEDTTLSFAVNAKDPDWDLLTYSAMNLPVNATFNTETGLFTWTPDFDQAGIYTVKFSVTDGTLSDTTTVMITVNNINVNHPPVLSAIPAKTVDAGNLLTFMINATDPDNDTITYSAANLPTNATFDASTQTFDWTPDIDQAGIYTIAFSVTDGILSDSTTAIITVNNVNGTPVLSPIPGTTPETIVDEGNFLEIADELCNEGTTLEFVINAVNGNPDVVWFSVTDLPKNAIFDIDTRTFTWTPDFDQAGVYTVTFYASDGTLTDHDTVTITVNDVAVPESMTGRPRVYIKLE